MGVSASQAAQVAAVTGTNTRDKETHVCINGGINNGGVNKTVVVIVGITARDNYRGDD